MKKIISAVLACSMLFTVCAAAGLENFESKNEYAQGQFTDVAESAWYNESVKCAYELGLVKGNSETTFNPEGEITIAEALVLACRMHSIYNGGDGVFEQGNPWYQVYVDYAVENEIITQEDYQDYTAKAKRSDFAVIMAASVPEEALGKINNIKFIPDVAEWDWRYKEEAFLLYNAGILTGSDEAGTFNPGSTIKRSEVATIVTRIALPELRKEFTLPEATREQLKERLKSGAYSAIYWLTMLEDAFEKGYETQDLTYCELGWTFGMIARMYIMSTLDIANEVMDDYYDYAEKAAAASNALGEVCEIEINSAADANAFAEAYMAASDEITAFAETILALF